jgi:hypothetical protein
VSACISHLGEFSEHEIGLPDCERYAPTDWRWARWTCRRCWALDETALLDALDAAEHERDRWREDAKAFRADFVKVAEAHSAAAEQAERDLAEKVRALHHEAYPGANWCAGCHDSAAREQWPCLTIRAVLPSEEGQS